MDDAETLSTPDGPFRTPEPTTEARLQKARHASWARVERLTTEAMEAEQRRARRLDRLAWVGLAFSLLVLGAVILSAGTPRGGHWLAWICPAIALVISAALAVGYRRRMGRPRQRRRS
jgi:CHASE2 domain-containing sensor protein